MNNRVSIYTSQSAETWDYEVYNGFGKIFEWRENLFREFIEDPQKYMDSPGHCAAAILHCDNMSTHQCYLNCCFCISVLLHFPHRLQKQYAINLLENGRSGYWEWVTHSGYNMAEALRMVGITVKDTDINGYILYCSPPEHILKQIAETFDIHA